MSGPTDAGTRPSEDAEIAGIEAAYDKATLVWCGWQGETQDVEFDASKFRAALVDADCCILSGEHLADIMKGFAAAACHWLSDKGVVTFKHPQQRGWFHDEFCRVFAESLGEEAVTPITSPGRSYSAPTHADLAPHGWAPGGYTALCTCCRRQIGNVGPSASKRSRTCRPCATKAWKAAGEKRS